MIDGKLILNVVIGAVIAGLIYNLLQVHVLAKTGLFSLEDGQE